MDYLTPEQAKDLIPLNEENFHLADSFTRIPIPEESRDGGTCDEVLYFLRKPENLTKAQYNKYLLKYERE